MFWFVPRFGWGRGWGWCRWFGGLGRGWGWGWRWWWRLGYFEEIPPKIERRILENEAEFLKAALSRIEKRLAQLEQVS